MRIHKVELRNVRQLKEVILDLSYPLTVIGGPNGIGKSTIQRAIHVAMFRSKKEVRDSLISRFDPSNPPEAVLELSRGNGDARIRLSRRLTDDGGEWTEGTATIKQKGKALEKLQECLPISADAAALLLWGLQEDMVAVLASFPPDGHTLLTAATIKGSGPDPKNIVDELENEVRKAKKGGKDPGPLAQAESRVDDLQVELASAQVAQGKRLALKRAFEEAKTARDQTQQSRADIKREIDQLDCLEGLLDKGLKANETFSKLETKHKDWEKLDGEIVGAQRNVGDLQEELLSLQRQFGVAKDQDFAQRIGAASAQIKSVETAEQKRGDIEKHIKSRKRPEKRDTEELTRLGQLISESSSRMEASGLHYDLSLAAGSKTVRITEDNAPEKTIDLVPGRPLEGVVGKVVVTAGDLRITAQGKEDIASHKRCIQQAQQATASLFKRFEVDTEDAFQLLAEETNRLLDDLKKAENELEKALKGSLLEILRADKERLEEARRQNQVTQQDFDECTGMHLPSVMDLDKKLSAKTAELERAKVDVRNLRTRLPNEDQKLGLQADLEDARRQALAALAAFKDAEPSHRDPSAALLTQIKTKLNDRRGKFDELTDPNKSPENEVARLAVELKYAGPEREISTIEADLAEAKSILHRQVVLQRARELLKLRIHEKINEMTADVPHDLGQKISRHLADLTQGAYGKIVLAEGLAVKGVYGGSSAEHWEPIQLSHGEQHQTALAVKIAVARALAETCGPVFIILDDSLVSFDPQRRKATEELLMSLAGDGKLQVILLTCHTDWAADWKRRAPDRVNYIELAKTACYYRPLAAGP